MDKITIDVGVYTALETDLTGFDFTGITKVILTIKNAPSPQSPVLFEQEFAEPKVYNVVIPPEVSLRLTDQAVYDFVKVLTDGKTYKNGDNGIIELRKGVGDDANH